MISSPRFDLTIELRLISCQNLESVATQIDVKSPSDIYFTVPTIVQPGNKSKSTKMKISE